MTIDKSKFILYVRIEYCIVIIVIKPYLKKERLDVYVSVCL